MSATRRLSPRLERVLDALPVRPDLRVIEIGGAPGALGRALAARVGPTGHVLEIDRSATGVAQILRACAAEIEAGTLSTLCAPVEDFALPPGSQPYDLAVACRVGALDGRFPQLWEPSLECLRRALRPGGRLYVDTGNPLTEISLV